MCVDPSSVASIEQLASPCAMERQVCPAPLDLRLRRRQCQGRMDEAEEEEEDGEEALDTPPRMGSTCGWVCWRLRPYDSNWPGRRWRREIWNAPDERSEWEGMALETGRVLGEEREGRVQPATPVSEPPGTMAETEGNRTVAKPGISLPPRKRPYIAACEEKPAATLKASRSEESMAPSANRQEHVRLKTEPKDNFHHCDAQLQQLRPSPLPTVNGYPYMESIYMPYRLQLPYYTGVSKSCIPPASFPICPVPTHPLAVSSIPTFHPGPCLQLRSQEDILASDIAMATRQDEDGDTPLHIAVVQEDSTMVEKLIQLLRLGKKDLDIYNNLRQTPLHLAVITKHSSLVRQLVTNGASRVLLDRNGQTAVHLACEHSSLECLQSLLASGQERIDLEIRNYDGYTPLHVAINSRNKGIATHLLDQGADVDAVDIKSGRTPLVHAAESNYMDMVNLLLEHGANVNLQTYSGNTALHSSSGRGLMEIVKVLLKNGADSSIKNCHNDTSLMVAKNKKVIDILRGKASRTVAQPLSCQRVTSVIKECPSPSSKSNSPLSVSHVLRCSSPSSQQKRSPQHHLPPSTLSPRQDSPSYQSSDSQMSSCQRSPLAGATTSSHPGTPRPEGRLLPEEMPVSAREERGQPTSQSYPWEKIDSCQTSVGTSATGLPTGAPPAYPVGHCSPGHTFPQIYSQGHLKHPLLQGASYPVLPFHQRYPGADGAFLNLLSAPLPALGNPAFVTHAPCPSHRSERSPQAGVKERHTNPLQAMPIRDGWPTTLHPQGRPSSRNSDHVDTMTHSANSKGRGES